MMRMVTLVEVSLELCVGRSVGWPGRGASMISHAPALQTQLSSQEMMPHSAVTQHSGPMYPEMNIIGMVRYWLMVNDVLPTNNTATTPGTLRTLMTLNTRKLHIYQLVKISLIEYLI